MNGLGPGVIVSMKDTVIAFGDVENPRNIQCKKISFSNKLTGFL